MSHPTSDDVVAAAINLAPQIHAARDELEATRQIPPPLVQALAAAGLLQLHLPRSMGAWNSRHSRRFAPLKPSRSSMVLWGGVP